MDIENLVWRHNRVVYKLKAFRDELSKTHIETPASAFFKGMEMYDALASEGLAICQMAREAGLNCKINMLTAEIFLESQKPAVVAEAEMEVMS